MQNPKQSQMIKTQNSKQYDLEDRTLNYTKKVIKSQKELVDLIQESTELMKIFGAILEKSK